MKDVATIRINRGEAELDGMEMVRKEEERKESSSLQLSIPVRLGHIWIGGFSPLFASFPSFRSYAWTLCSLQDGLGEWLSSSLRLSPFIHIHLAFQATIVPGADE